ncbi:MAG: hypothetical protein ACI8RD_007145, partial [Bacillariaceae sp.]
IQWTTAFVLCCTKNIKIDRQKHTFTRYLLYLKIRKQIQGVLWCEVYIWGG